MSSCSIQKNTLTFDELAKGWTSFHSFQPDYMIGMNSQFFSFKDGELYLHNSDEVFRNHFYGVDYPTKVSVMVNDAPDTIKELLAVSLEGNKPWLASLTAYTLDDANISVSSIFEEEFVNKEGFWYGYARRNENFNNYNSKATYGIGEVLSIDLGLFTLTVKGYSSSLTTGDSIYRAVDQMLVGNVVSFQRDGDITIITLDGLGPVDVADFVFGHKDQRAEGGNLRGYNLKIDLQNNSIDKVELFAVNSEVIKSYT